MWGMEAEPKVLQISRYSRQTIVTARSSSAETRLYFTCRFAAYTRTCALVLSRPHLICMYALFLRPSSTVTIENKLTFLGFIFVSSKPAEETWRRTGEVSPYSQAVNPRQVTPPPPSLSPPPPTPFFSLSHPFSLPRLRNSPTLHHRHHPPPPFSHSLFIGRLSSLSEADTSFVEADSHSLRRLLHTALASHVKTCGLPPSIHLF